MRVQVVHKMQWKGHVLPVGHRFEIEDGVELPYGVRPVKAGEPDYRPPLATDVERRRAEELAAIKAEEKAAVEATEASPDNPMSISEIARQVEALKGLEKQAAEAAGQPVPLAPPKPPPQPRASRG